MSNILTQNRLLSRRHFLRGCGTVMALPLLDAMTTLFASANAAAKPRRSVFVYIPNGVNGMAWQVKQSGRGYELSPSLKALEKHRDDFTVFSGLHHPNGLGQARVCADTWLTGAKIDAQSARQYHNTVSCDQLMAEVTSKHTRFASLELSISSETGQPNNSTTLAFSRDGVPLPALLFLLFVAHAAKPAPAYQTTDAKVPFRAAEGNQNLPWYRLKPGEFPPLRSEHRVGGTLAEADYIHRCGVFRRDGTGELTDFSLLPFVSVRYLNAEADLRDVPLGTHFLFRIYLDNKGRFTQAATMQDDASMADAHTPAGEQQQKNYRAFLKARGVPGTAHRAGFRTPGT